MAPRSQAASHATPTLRSESPVPPHVVVESHRQHTGTRQLQQAGGCAGERRTPSETPGLFGTFPQQGISPRARALASWDRKFRASSDHLPPPQLQERPNLAQARRPNSSRHVSFHWRARLSAAPYSSAAWLVGLPSLLRRAHTRGCRWQAEHRRSGRPSATTSNLRPSATSGKAMSRSR